ncbi:MAG: hypothetical protein ACTS22_00185 [Phycisphaerales bacterium]
MMEPRELHLVSIVHGDRDMGCLSARLRSAADEAVLAQKRAVVSALWDRIDQWAASLHVERVPTRVYQDGLPVCNHEQEIVRDLARQGVRNHLLLERLVARGAVLMGTEDADLLLRELELARRIASGAARPEDEDAGRALLHARDRFIAGRIDRTLCAGELGVLFVGALHDVAGHLPADIRVNEIMLLEPAASTGDGHE